jgi:hypothetical protein
VRIQPKLLVALLLVPICGLLFFKLSSDWYHKTELEEHRRYLHSLLARQLTVSQLESELGIQPLRIVGAADAEAISQIWTNPLNSPAEIVAKVTKWPETRFYRKSPMVYLIYFDANGRMRDFSCLAS